MPVLIRQIPEIFGAEPPHTWCYYFEKADLARQLQDWQSVLQLEKQAREHGFTPKFGPEYVPFIEAADGVILSGTSGVDESLVTGETLPRNVVTGQTVYAGTLNRDAVLKVSVSAAAGSSLVDEVQKLLEKAGEARSRRLILADRAARLYAPVVHLTALLSAVGWLIAGAGLHQAVIIATTVLIITCPCALALAIPAVQVVAAGALFRRGIFLNAGDAIERLGEVDTVVFDKTGTLTLPEPRVANAADVSSDVLEDAARLALSSRHPLAMALTAELPGVPRPFDNVSEEAGFGIRAKIASIEARLGSPAWCGVISAAHSGADAPSTAVFERAILAADSPARSTSSSA